MRLVYKGIAIAAIPLIFELVLVVTLAMQLNALEKERVLAAKGRDMVSSLSTWSRNMADAAIFLVVARYHEDAREEQKFRNSLKSMETRAITLTKQAESLPELKSEVSRLKAQSDNIVAQLTWQMHPTDVRSGSTVFSSNLDMRNQLEPQIVEFIRSCDKVSTHVKEVTKSESGENLSYLWQWLMINAVGTVLVSIVVAWFVFGNIVNRILAITRQTQYFKETRKLPPLKPLQGNDEITALDSEFRDMVNVVREASQRRDDFTSMISHDLRSPLTSIKIILSMARSGSYGNLNEGGQRRIENAENSIDRLIGMVNQLLDAEKLEAGLFQLSLEKCGLMEVLYPAVEAVRGMAEAKQVELIFKCQDEPVEADVERLSQVVQNLLSNAIKFTPKWGKITLKSEEYKDCYRILVIDTGSGIKEEYLPKVFDRFQQVPQDSPQNKGGTGLGLAICKGIVEAHGGEIGVESLEGKGSTFWFTLPKLK